MLHIPSMPNSRISKLIMLCAALLVAFSAAAQKRSCTLTVNVTSAPGDNLEGQTVTVTQTDYQIGYGVLTLDANGSVSLKVYPGNHTVAITRDGFEPVSKAFSVAAGATTASVDIALKEATRKPFALKAEPRHDAYTGRNSLSVSWNIEAPAFFDDFESYSPFAISFGNWTGIDGDTEATAALVGSYPNRGGMQYAQIISPLSVTPTWWYDYPVLRPYAGQQYAGFVRTSSGNANDDWLISPAVNVSTGHVLSFMAKAADRYDERFMVYVTTKLDNPSKDDFVRIDRGNYEAVDYKEWHKMQYDLSDYAGKTIKFAIRYIGQANTTGAFMLMVDDVFVGSPDADLAAVKEASRARAMRARRSPANPNESFNVYLDGTKVATTDSYSCVIDDVAAGSHTVAVEAVYLSSVSERTLLDVTVPDGPFCRVDFAVSADSYLPADVLDLQLISLTTGAQYAVTTEEGRASIASLPAGRYAVNIAEGAYEAYNNEVDITKDATLNIALVDHVIDPFNITADSDDFGYITLRWNIQLSFEDSFESYDDFATGTFGEWTSLDLDGQPVYPIALGSQDNIVNFPGSGNATNPTAIAPMVFNPWKTVPAMLPTDPAIQAPTGDKTVIFFSPQGFTADKWLISPLLDIREGYEWSVAAKAYSSMYPESIEFHYSEGSTSPADFVQLSYADNVPAEQWTRYSVSLNDLVGKKVRLAVRYTSRDAFLIQVDDFKVGRTEGDPEFVEYGNVMHYDVAIDGVKAGETVTPSFPVKGLSEGTHTAAITAVYKNSSSRTIEYTFSVGQGGVSDIVIDSVTDNPAVAYDIYGRTVDLATARGIIIVRRGGKFQKILRK